MVNLEIKEADFDTGKVVLHYAEGLETGAPLVLLHGGSACWQYFTAILPYLVPNWHIFAPDLRGHGASGRVAWHYAVRDYAEDIVAFVTQVSGPAFLFGHSLGGIVALMTASLCPGDIRGVIVGDSPLDAATWGTLLKDSQAKLRRWRVISGGSVPTEQISVEINDDWFAPMLYHQDPDVLGMLLDDYDHAAAGYQMELILPKIQCPVLLLQADPEAGGAMTDEEVSRALPLLAHPSHVRFSGLSHLLFAEKKEPVLNAMEAFLKPLQ